MTAKRILVALAVVTLFSLGVLADNQAPITQGEFAVLLASNLKAPAPQGGWTPESAIQMLTGIGLSPLNGSWQSGSQLNEGTMVHILRDMGLALYSTAPDAIVTKAKANAVFFRYDDFFQNYIMKTKTVGGDNTTHIDTGVAGSESGAPDGIAPPASPVLP